MHAEPSLQTSGPAPAGGLVGALWLGYWGLMVALSGVSLLTGLDHPLDLVEGVFHALSLVALWGWLRGIAVGTSGLWRGYLVLFLLNMFWGLAGLASGAGGEPVDGWWLVLVIVLGLNGPLCYALWRYGFRSEAIWRSNA